MPAKLPLEGILGPAATDYIQADGPVIITAVVACVEGMTDTGERWTWAIWDDRSSLATSVGLAHMLARSADDNVTRSQGDDEQ